MDIEEIVKDCYSWSELYRVLLNKNTPNGGTLTRFKNKYSHLDTSHFDMFHKRRKYKVIEIPCPVCKVPFKTKDGGSEKTVTCSSACANTHFRTGINHGNWNPDRYQSTCFYYHKKECVVCKEDKIVTVHHLDENHNNNDPANLIPLCPTHHQYWHSRYKYLVEDIVLNYIKDYNATLPQLVEGTDLESVQSQFESEV